MGRQVILTEAGAWLGGQLTSQAVPPDEHPWVESTGVMARYWLLREAVRKRYEQTRWLTEPARRDPLFNPGQDWVSNVSAEPVIFRDVLDDMLRTALSKGTLGEKLVDYLTGRAAYQRASSARPSSRGTRGCQ
jgi:hypothetical protein